MQDLSRVDAPLVLAVSGGLDSMVLLDAAARAVSPDRLLVATFDHGTGPAATDAAALVADAARAHGLAVRCGRARGLPHREAAWRAARWRFLHAVAAAHDGRVVTAHTADDQVETLVMRTLRGTGARGLAGLYAASPMLRPFIRVHRARLAAHAAEHGVLWLEDPSNASRRFLRNRIRHDLLPALVRVRPGIAQELLDIASRAAAWRVTMDALAEVCCPARPVADGSLSVAAADLVGYDPAALTVLWPSIAGRVGIALDQRGTHRLAAFTTRSTPGAVMPLPAGWQVVREAAAFTVRRVRGPAPAERELPPAGWVGWGDWVFRTGEGPGVEGRWEATLPAGPAYRVRAWRPVDRVLAGQGMVRVKRMLAEAGVAAADRAGWPVVVADDAIVWIPGVSRVHAATARSGRPGVRIRCDPRDR